MFYPVQVQGIGLPAAPELRSLTKRAAQVVVVLDQGGDEALAKRRRVEERRTGCLVEF